MFFDHAVQAVLYTKTMMPEKSGAFSLGLNVKADRPLLGFGTQLKNGNCFSPKNFMRYSLCEGCFLGLFREIALKALGLCSSMCPG